jgi:hypothetical protein
MAHLAVTQVVEHQVKGKTRLLQPFFLWHFPATSYVEDLKLQSCQEACELDKALIVLQVNMLLFDWLSRVDRAGFNVGILD